MPRTTYLVLCGFLLLATLVSLTAYAEDDSTELPPSVDFSGRIVLIISDRSSAIESRRSTEMLREPTIQKIGDRYFIVGDAVLRQRDSDESMDWRAGAEVGIAWDIVQHYYAYTPERFEEFLERRADDEDE